MILRLTILFIALGLLVFFLLGRRTVVQFKRGMRMSAGERAALRMMQTTEGSIEFIQRIPERAEKHRRLMEKSFGESMQYQKSDFARMDSLIEKAWGKDLPKQLDSLVMTFGAYFGETVRRLRGGRWDYEEGRGYCLRDIGGQATIYPYDKVRKRFQNGREDSLAVFYTALARKLDENHPS